MFEARAVLLKFLSFYENLLSLKIHMRIILALVKERDYMSKGFMIKGFFKQGGSYVDMIYYFPRFASHYTFTVLLLVFQH